MDVEGERQIEGMQGRIGECREANTEGCRDRGKEVASERVIGGCKDEREQGAGEMVELMGER